jgi:cell division protein FtsB
MASERSTSKAGEVARSWVNTLNWLRPVLGILFLLALAIASYTLGRHSADKAFDYYKNLNSELDAEVGQLRVDNTKKTAQIADLQSQVDSIKKKIAALMPPPENTYKIDANTSLIVAGGHLTVGLIGTPGNDSVNLNINSNQYVAAAGQTINVSPDPSTRCRIQVVSFDILQSMAIVGAKCDAVEH